MLYYDRNGLSEEIDPAKKCRKNLEKILVKNVQFATIAFLMMGLNFKILSVMVAMV